MKVDVEKHNKEMEELGRILGIEIPFLENIPADVNLPKEVKIINIQELINKFPDFMKQKLPFNKFLEIHYGGRVGEIIKTYFVK